MRGRTAIAMGVGLLLGLLFGVVVTVLVWWASPSPDFRSAAARDAVPAPDERYEAVVSDVVYSSGERRVAVTVTDTSSGDRWALELPEGDTMAEWTGPRTVVIEHPAGRLALEVDR